MKTWVGILLVMFLANWVSPPLLDKEWLGQWKLVETMEDQGDGSGVFRKVQSNKILTIEPSGRIQSNGDLCVLSKHIAGKNMGQLTRESDRIVLNGCKGPFKPVFEMDQRFLIVYYPCKETCAERYRKIKGE
jgi:hypothetical protein